MDLAARIRSAILGGRFAPGALLSQTDLAREFAVSRIPVRDALLGLAAEKLVEVIPGKGARVIRLPAPELAEVFDLRIMLECDLLRRAVPRADAAARAEAEYALRKSSLEAGRPGWHEGDWLFHRTLYLPAGRPRQLAMVEELRRICVLHAARYAALAAATAQWLQDHEAMARAYTEGRAGEAAAILAQHLQAAHRHLAALQDGAP